MTETIVTVSALAAAVHELIATAYPAPIWVRGEVSNFSRSANGHVYFTLKEGAAGISCTLWRYRAQRLTLPKEGDAVEVLATLAVYEPRGQFQLDVQAIRAAGSGAWYQRFLAVKAKLEAEGLFDPRRKRPLPRYPRRIAVVTSPQADALHDLMKTLSAKAPMILCVLFPALVQGSDAPQSLADALAAVAQNAHRLRLEAVLVIRGGGAAEDLAAFNEEIVARAIAAQPIPVVTGIGHETDTTIADFVADVRAHTPTGAAERIAEGWNQAMPLVHRLAERLQRAFAHQWQRDMLRFDHLVHRLQRATPQRLIDREQQRLAVAARDLTLQARARFQEAQRRLEQLSARLSHPRQLFKKRQERLLLVAQRLPHPLRLIAPFHQRLTRLEGRLQRARPTLAPLQEALARREAQLAALSPLAVLARGYALVCAADGQVVGRAAALRPPQPVVIRFVDGSAAAEIVSVDQVE